MPQRIKVLIACHRPYPVPNDPCYLPVEVGTALHAEPIPGFVPDDTGDNISRKAGSYCELSALYWAWRNLDADYVGLVHYRRHFGNGRVLGSKADRVISGEQLLRELGECDVLLPKARNYWIETSYSHYAHAHHAIDLDTTRAILCERQPAYVRAFDDVMGRTSGHRFNMLVMGRGRLDAYCAWLFGVLSELEGRLDISGYSPYDARVFGFVAERLLDVWLEVSGCAFRELPVVFMEGQNWPRKGGAFVLRKFGVRVR